MSKRIISTFLAFFLTAVVLSPMVIAMVDKTVEISAFETSEEEKDTRGEKTPEMEKLLSYVEIEEFSSEMLDLETYLGYCYKSYPIPHLNLISPPPESV